jgi:SAM-dependent methyltransferase
MRGMSSNREMVELWNGEASATWSSHPEKYDAMLGELGERVLAAAALSAGERVLDVGCGGGQLALQAAHQVGETGSVLGVDVSSELLAVTRRRATEAGLTQVQVLEADAQEHTFPASSYDAVVSRFGVMFFADPVAAFANLLQATVPGGRLAFVAWQAAPLNEWVMVPMGAMIPHVGFPDLPAPGAPGPFAFGDAERLRGIVTEAGWADVAIEDVQTTVSAGGARTADEAVEFVTEDTFGRMLLGKAEPEQRAAALAALREAYEPYVGADGVRVKAAVWLVTARRPAA